MSSSALPIKPPASRPYRLSKSKYLSGLQCPKRLYLDIHSPDLAEEPDEQTRAILDMGTEVGALARRRFPGGVLVEADHRHAAEALRRTAELIADRTVPAIFEAALEFDNVLVRVDVLERVPGPAPDGPDAWRLIEVKASTRVKEVHHNDLAIQCYVLRGAGLPLRGAALLHINTQYLYAGGEADVTELFRCQDLTDLVLARQDALAARLAALKATVEAAEAPAIEPDGHCHSPYACPFWSHCTQHKPERWIYHLPNGDPVLRALAPRGIEVIDEIPQEVRLTVWQRRMKDNVEWVGPRLRTMLDGVRYPVHHLDFETVMAAIPLYPGTRPYQTIPTQWSNHIEDDGGETRHDEYLWADPRDPREALAVALLESLGREGSICVYSGYERHILESLANALPSLREDLLALVPRLWDLHPIVKDHYYHPAFNGSYSIKSVLPALVPDLDYADLAIGEGGVAAMQYLRMVFGETDLIEKLRIREALLRYCARDTQGLLEIRRALLKKC